MKATEVTAGLAESNGSLLPGLWRDLLHVICGLTACAPGSAPGPTLGNEYGKTLPNFNLVPEICSLTDRETDRHVRHNTALRSGGGLTTAASIFGNFVDADVSNVRSGEAERN